MNRALNVLIPLFVLVAVVSSTASAAVIYHEGFEVPDAEPQGGGATLPTGWTGNAYIEDPGYDDYWPGSSDNSQTLAYPADGYQTSYFYTAAGASSNCVATSPIFPATTVAGTTYTLSCAIFERLDGLTNGASWKIELLDNLNAVASYAVPHSSTRGWFSAETSYVAPSSDHTLQAQFTLAPSAASGQEMMVDNVIVTTPEPNSLILVTTGLIGLLAYAWRRRR